MESQTGENNLEPEAQHIDNPEQLCLLIKDILGVSFEASYFEQDSSARKMLETNAAEMIQEVNRYYLKNHKEFSIREREMFVQFIRLRMNRMSMFILRGIELLGALEYRLKPVNFGIIDHKVFYRKMLPYLVELIENFLQDQEPNLQNLVSIGEFSSAIIASEFYQLGRTYYEEQVYDLHQAFRDLIIQIVEYKVNLSDKAVPVMNQFKYFLEGVINQLNKDHTGQNFKA
jgi:hypothetical protein